MFNKLSTILTIAVFTIMTLTAVTSHAQYPQKTINYIIPFGPGGESDITARHQQKFSQKILGEDIVIEYKPGGGGAVGWSQLNNYPSDGYTWMGVNLPHIIIKPLQKDVGFKTKDLAVVYMFHYTPDAIVVNNDSPYKTLNDLVKDAKANPAKITLSGSGKGTANHLAQVRFDQMANVKTTYVAFKGTGASVTALLGKQVKAQWGYTSVGAKHKNKTRLLAVAMEKRHPLFPNVPTFKELGYNLVSGAYRGIAVPKSTPEKIRKQVSNAIAKINSNPKFRKKMQNDGMAMLDVPYSQIKKFIKEKTTTYTIPAKAAKVIK